MKNITIAWLVLPILFLFSCKDDDEMSFIKISKYTISRNFEKQEQTIYVESSSSWNATNIPQWCNLQPSSGNKGKTEVVVSFTENLTGDARQYKIGFTNSKDKCDLNVQQSSQLILKLPTTNYTYTWEGGTVPIVSDSKAYQIVSKTDDGWLTYDQKNDILKLTAAKNQTDQTRIATITLKDKNSDELLQVLIIQHSSNPKSALYQITSMAIDGTPCIIDQTTRQLFFPIDMDASTKESRKLEFEGLAIDYLLVGNSTTKIYSGQTVNLSDFMPGKTIILNAYNNLSGNMLQNKLLVTGLPIIAIDAPLGIVDEPKRPCTLTIIDPKGRTNGSLFYTKMFAGIEFRGSGALRYDKKAFAIKITSDALATQSADASFINLRTDNNWILDAMWLDNAKMRNRVCFDIWNQFNQIYYKTAEPKANTGTHGDLVEVFLDGKYHGMYVLSDKLDRKQLQIKKDGGYLYKNGDWTDECILQGFTSPYNNNSLNWNGVESDYPDEMGLIDFKYYHNLLEFVSKSSKEDFASKFEEYIDIDNMVDYFIFTNLIVAYDNLGRNTYWGLYNIKKSTKMFPLMWDMDGTLGRTWDGAAEDPNMGWLINNRHNGKSYKIFERIMNENPADIKSKIKARWNDAKNKSLIASNLNERVDYYTQQQIKSGAATREMNRWATGYSNAEAEANYIKTWYAKRWAKMDQLINDL